MKKELEKIRKELYEQLQSGKREHRRATLQAFKLVNKACNLLKIDKLQRVTFRSQVQPITYPITEEQTITPPPTFSDVIATNAPDEQPGPEKPKRSRKSKGV
jgi:hypothetical protein